MKHININRFKTSIEVNESYEGERIETKIERIVNNNEPIGDGAPLIYTERKDGVGAQYDIRTDRFEIAIDAMDKVSGSIRAKRENNPNMQVVKGGKNENINGGPESTQATK